MLVTLKVCFVLACVYSTVLLIINLFVPSFLCLFVRLFAISTHFSPWPGQ